MDAQRQIRDAFAAFITRRISTLSGFVVAMRFRFLTSEKVHPVGLDPGYLQSRVPGTIELIKWGTKVAKSSPDSPFPRKPDAAAFSA